MAHMPNGGIAKVIYRSYAITKLGSAWLVPGTWRSKKRAEEAAWKSRPRGETPVNVLVERVGLCSGCEDALAEFGDYCDGCVPISDDATGEDGDAAFAFPGTPPAEKLSELVALVEAEGFLRRRGRL